MSRPLRIEFSGALYHITARGNARQNIYINDDDRDQFLVLLAKVCERYGWYCHAYCLMANHYHLLIETVNPNLSKGMKFLNGGYTQYFNRAHGRVGHVFQGRFKGILVEREAYLLELSRYIVLNPVRAEMVRSAKDWPWSSYRATAGFIENPAFLTIDWILAAFANKTLKAQESYRTFVSEGRGLPSVWQELKNQIYLGDERFVEDMQCKVSNEQSLKGIPKLQKLGPKKPITFYADKYAERKTAMACAYLAGHYSLTEVGEYFEVSYATVSRAVKSYECQM
ncbi:MAG: transposase [Pseudomonadales bacterium]|nr:transposase [Pseudomonadales bacterium]